MKHRASRVVGALVIAVVAAVLASCGSRADEAEREDVEGPAPQATAPPGTGSAPTSRVMASTTAAPPEGNPSQGCSLGMQVATGSATEEPVFMPQGERNVLRYIPTTYDGVNPMPVVINLHGYVTGALVHNRLTGFDELAEAHAFISITPDGVGPPSGLDDGNDVPIWNVVGNSTLPDDAGFVLTAVDSVTDQLCVDLDRVYLAGMSNGSHLASELICNHADQFAAVAAVAGFLTPAGCHPSRPVPLIAFHGTDDEYVKFDGGIGNGLEQLNPPDELFDVLDEAYDGITVPAIPASASSWARRNGCHGDAAVEAVTDEVELRSWSDCPPVQLYVIEGGGQSWPGSALFVAVEATSGYTTMDIDANQLIWAFFGANPITR